MGETSSIPLGGITAFAGARKWLADGWKMQRVCCGLCAHDHGTANDDFLGFAVWHPERGPDRGHPFFARWFRHSGRVELGGEWRQHARPVSDIVKCRGGRDKHRLVCDPATMAAAMALADREGSTTIYLTAAEGDR